MRKVNKFIIIDDDPHNNLLCKFMIGAVTKDTEVVDFNEPERGFEYIESFYSSNENPCPTTVFLDIYMPSMSGWEFLKKVEQLSEHIKKQLTFYILSSSIDWSDKEKAQANVYVKNYVTKPLSKGTVENILSGIL